MEKIKVLIIDDSSIVHILLKKVFLEFPDIFIVGEAYDGREGVDLAMRESPDVIIMDIGMPKMDGLEAIQVIMQEKPTPIIVLSAASNNTIGLGFKAIELGAVELIEKPYTADFSLLKKVIEEKLIKSIRTFSDFKVIRRLKGGESYSEKKRIKEEEKVKTREALPNAQVEQKKETRHKVEGFPIIGIAASTGGPQTIKKLLAGFPVKEMGAGVVILQHIADGFVQGFCDWLNESSSVKIEVAKEGEAIRPNVISIAPDGHHLIFDHKGRFLFEDSPPIVGIRPSADIMIDSLGKVYKERVIVLILTGMGGDGSKGLAAVKENGGYVIAQDEESSLIFGMPKMAIETGLVDKVMGLDKMSEFLVGLYHERFRDHS